LDSVSEHTEGKVAWRVDPKNFVLPEGEAMFQAGSVDIAHTWFQARKDVRNLIFLIYVVYHMCLQRLVDEPGPSRTLADPETTEWIAAITDTESDIDHIFSLIAPKLHRDGIRSLECSKVNFPDHPGVHSWPSSFSGIGIIVNRKTPLHRDPSGRMEWYDILLAAGTYTTATLDVADLGARFKYTPGTVVALCGRVFRHGVMSWEGGERICYAHYMRNNVLNRQEIQNSSWVEDKQYKEWMSQSYLSRQVVLEKSRRY
jgi:hypothetical protein